MATTQSINQKFANPELTISRALTVAAGNMIYEGTLVGIDSNGLAINANTTNRVAGVAKHSKNAGWEVTVYYNHLVNFDLPGVAVSDLGSTVYASDNNTLTTTANVAPVGQVVSVDVANNKALVHCTLYKTITGAGVDSVFGRAGAVVASNGDYTASQITYDNSVSGLTAIRSQAAIDEIDSDLDTHIANKANPHDYPKASVYTFEDTNPGTFVLLQPVWEDMRVVPTAFDFAGVSDPTLVNWQPGGAGTTFKLWEFATNDEAFFSVQLPHSYKIGTDLKAHIHWTPGGRGATESGNTVAWKMDYTWANFNAAFPSSSNIDLTDTCSGINDQHEITADTDPPGAGKDISSMLICRIYRDTGDTWTGTGTGNLPLLLEVDFHFEVDTIGSRQSNVK